MRFSIASIVATLASIVTANTIEFVNQDATTRTVHFTATAGMKDIPAITLGSYSTNSVSFPTGWIGNWYSVSAGATNVPGMLGEVAWNGWAGSHYFDVSAIVNPNDMSGVKMIYPKVAKTPLSGCQTFPCSNAYNLPDDIQTLSTTETTLVCLLGSKSAQTPSARRHAREFVVGQHTE